MKHFLLGIAMLLAASSARAQFSPGPLSNAHRRLRGPTHCTACHALAAGGPKYKCLSCHVEIRRRLAANAGLHATLLGANRSEQRCVKCHSDHNGEDFVPIRWDVNKDDFDHRQAGYPLEGAHRGLACARCHNPQRISPAARKLVVLQDLKRTYLGLSRECASCHTDVHAGQLGAACDRCHTSTRWKDTGRFDHSAAKFRLAGAHERVACAKCHKPAAGRTQFTGLSFSSCTACHGDPHRSAFAAPCRACHSEAAWKPALRVASNFDHSRTRFALDGRHAAVACRQCHHGAGFKDPVAHTRCDDCHRDAHNAQFAARADRGDCGACHTAAGWKPATFTAARHAETRYPLDGRHVSVACARCHVPQGQATVYRVRFTRCDDCHADAHKGQFAAAPYQNRCQDCHSTAGFQPSQFKLARHRRTRFPLSGAHEAVPCTGCHTRGPGLPAPPVRFRFADLACSGCHDDPHAGQFRARMAAGNAGCQACHTGDSWHDMTRFDHGTARFALEGTHRGVACRECHRPANLALGMRNVVFRAAPSQCSACHEDVHAGQFGRAACASCHGLNKWKPARFDHDRAAFALTGAHREVACRQCHTRQREAGGRLVVVYKPAPKECSGCHERHVAD